MAAIILVFSLFAVLAATAKLSYPRTYPRNAPGMVRTQMDKSG
jgi:hypothetical protein